ncbi:MAG TPA: hypothetical protein VEW67_09465 [Thermoleophilaceae bacterium]|nr:hypothetical protein [Thermoleophilaceae bacterium]
MVLTAQTFTIWGVPWAASHDNYRPVSGYCGAPNADSSGGAKSTFGMPVSGLPGGFAGPEGGCTQEPQSYDPSWGPIRPFFTTQTWCEDPKPTTEIVADNWHTDVVGTATSGAPQPSDCGALPFDASLDVQATSTKADGPTGLDVDLTVQQNNDPPAAVRFNPDDDSGAPAYWKAPQGRATSHLDETVVTLPDGVSVNPAGADGLVGCTDQQVGLLREGVDGNGVGGGFGIDEGIEWSTEDPLDGSGVVECPPASILGVARVRSGLLDLPLDGHLILGAPKSTDPASGRMFRMFLVVRSAEQGLLVKLLGSAVADPRTGRLTVRFDENPQLPFDEVNVDVKGGDNAVLALQQRCDSRPWATELRPWSRNAPVVEGGGFVTQTNCGFDFAPSLEAGMSSRSAGGSGSFSFTFSRTDGQQWFQGLTAELPPGLLASVKDVPLCSNAQVDAFVNNQEAAGRPVGQPCSAASRIGTVDAGAGSGAPYFLETKGSAYLTEGYKGGEYGLAVVVPVEAGPFKGASALKTIVVRQALHVDRTDASVTAVSDPLPQIWHGIPLRVRQATVRVDRPGFMRNPTGCSLKSIRANFVSAEGVSATRDSPFQVTGCGSLSFKPKLALRLTGRKQVTTGKHPGIRAQVTQRGGEAGVKKAVVRLPKSLALDVNNAQSLCEFADGIKDDLENHCPKGSIVGRARAVSPLLKEPLAGDVFFVKNVRIDPRTGNEIRTLPMIIVALRGEVAINLRGVSSTTKNGRLVNTFDKVPDAPIERFNLNIAGGKNGIIAVTRTKRARINLCSKSQRQVAEADFDGQNGKRHDRDIRMTTPCKKRAAKRPTARKRAVADSR